MARKRVNKHSAVNHSKKRCQIDKRSNEDESSLKSTVINHTKEKCQIDGQNNEDSVLKLRLSSLKKQNYKFKEYKSPSFKQIVNQHPDIKLSPKLKRLNMNPKIVVTDNAFQNCIKSFVKLKERLSKVSWSEEAQKKCFKVTCSDCKIDFTVMKEYVKNLANLKAKLSQLKFWNEDDPQNCRISITTTDNHEIVAASVPDVNDENKNHQENHPEAGTIDKSEKLKLAKEMQYNGKEKQTANTKESEIKIEVQCEDEEMEVTNIENFDTIESCANNIEITKNTNDLADINVDEFSLNQNQNCIPNPEAVLECNVAPMIIPANINESVVKIEVQREDEEMEVTNIENLQAIESCENNTETINNTSDLEDINVHEFSLNQNCIPNPEAVLECNVAPVVIPANTNESVVKIEVQREDEEMEVTNIENLQAIESCENNIETINNTSDLEDINVHELSSNENQNCIPNVSKNTTHPSFQNIFSLYENIILPEEVLECNVTPVVMLGRMDVFKWYEEEVHKLRQLVSVRGTNSHTTESQSLPSCQNVIELENSAKMSSCIASPSNTNDAELQNRNCGTNNSQTLNRGFSCENNENNCSEKGKRNSSGRQQLLTEWLQKPSVVPQKQTTITQQQQCVISQQHRMPLIISQQTVTQQSVRPQVITSLAIAQQSITQQATMRHAILQQQPTASCSTPQVHIIRHRQPQQQQQQQRYPQLQQQRYPRLQQQRYYPHLTQQQRSCLLPRYSQAARQQILQQSPRRINILRNSLRYLHQNQNITSTNNLPNFNIPPVTAPVSQNNSNTQNQPIRLQLNPSHTEAITDNASNSTQQNGRRSQNQYLIIKPTLDLIEKGNRYSR